MITDAGIAEATWRIWSEKEGPQDGRAYDYWRTVELSLDQHEIAEAAWQIWDKEGRQERTGLEYWARAEQQVLGARRREDSRINGAAAPARANGSSPENGESWTGLSKSRSCPVLLPSAPTDRKGLTAQRRFGAGTRSRPWSARDLHGSPSPRDPGRWR